MTTATTQGWLSDEQIVAYQRDGAIVIKGVFKDWIESLRAGFDRVLQDPSEHGRENVTGTDTGRFFEDYCNWQRIPEFRRWIEQSPGAAIVGEATASEAVQVFHEHILVKEPGTSKATPWHQDNPYYCVDGDQTGSYWIPLDPITPENALQVVLGSHRWPKPVRPSKWSTNASWYADDSPYMDMPDIDNGDFEILIPEMELGMPCCSTSRRCMAPRATRLETVAGLSPPVLWGMTFALLTGAVLPHRPLTASTCKPATECAKTGFRWCGVVDP
ncbi:phytanoyl-CoA dioxygenase family protein [Oceanimonas sp. NS1]|nr:phytanoyl-CoA dioxygenase family protein [Oceanimonas sp. NS1]